MRRLDLNEQLLEKLKNCVAKPKYELRIKPLQGCDNIIEIYQIPSPATPSLEKPKFIAKLEGRNLALIESYLLRYFKPFGIKFDSINRKEKAYEIDEFTALDLGLIFRVLSPMSSREKMQTCVKNLTGMEKEEMAYWLGKIIYRKKPTYVINALRTMLLDPDFY